MTTPTTKNAVDAADGAVSGASVAAELAIRSGVAVAGGVATFVPVPFLGDWLVSRSRRQLVERVLRRHGRTYPVSAIKPFYDEGWGAIWLMPFRIVKGLVISPIKRMLRTVFFILGIRDVVLTVGLTLAMAHVLDRMLRTGSLRDDDDAGERRLHAERLRKATIVAYGGIDQRVVKAALAALGRVVRQGTLGVIDVGDVGKDGGAVSAFLAELDDRVDKALLKR